MTRRGHLAAELTSSVAELADLVLGRACGGCSAPGTRWCAGCSAAFGQPVLVRRLPGLTVFSCAPYDGPLREALNGWKDHGRTDLSPVFAAALSGPLLDAQRRPAGAAAPVALVPVPSSARSRRTRGREPVRELVLGVRPRRPVLPALRHARLVAEQSTLDAVQRTRNLRGALEVAPGWAARVAGREVVVVDDLVTSGATLVEAARSLQAARARVVAAVTLAATARHRSPENSLRA